MLRHHPSLGTIIRRNRVMADDAGRFTWRLEPLRGRFPAESKVRAILRVMDDEWHVPGPQAMASLSKNQKLRRRWVHQWILLNRLAPPPTHDVSLRKITVIPLIEPAWAAAIAAAARQYLERCRPEQGTSTMSTSTDDDAKRSVVGNPRLQQSTRLGGEWLSLNNESHLVARVTAAVDDFIGLSGTKDRFLLREWRDCRMPRHAFACMYSNETCGIDLHVDPSLFCSVVVMLSDGDDRLVIEGHRVPLKRGQAVIFGRLRHEVVTMSHHQRPRIVLSFFY